MADSKTGPLTAADLLAVWQAATDAGYSAPLVAAGDGGGLEVYNQAFAQLARASAAIDATLQALYLLPSSAQTSPPAAGALNATVTLNFTRTGLLDRPLRLGAGLLFYEEVARDWGDSAGQDVPTGRRYTLLQDVVFMPGDSGPLQGTAVAERPGYGYNNPAPGSIKLVDQPAVGYFHDRATLLVNPGSPTPGLGPLSASLTLQTVNEADTFVPDHVGRYALFTAGANAGKVARVTSFSPPQPALGLGSTVGLEPLVVVEAYSPPTGNYQAGELLAVKAASTIVGWGTLVARADYPANNHTKLAFVLLQGSVSAGNTVTGQVGGAVATVGTVLYDPAFTAEAPPVPATAGTGASWRVLDLAADCGLTVSNPDLPKGGRAGMLDMIGRERNRPRAPGESDDSYRQRLATIADTVTPNAVKRAATRVMGGLGFCLREVGTPLLPGFFYDRLGDPTGDFYDYDVLVLTGVLSGSFVNPAAGGGFQEPVVLQRAGASGLLDTIVSGYFGRLDAGNTRLTLIRRGGQGTLAFPYVFQAFDRVTGLVSGAQFQVSGQVADPYSAQYRWHTYMNVEQFRAFFLVGLPRLGFGEFGFAYDAGATGAYDASPYADFYDGYPYLDAPLYRSVKQTIDAVRAAGVGFELYPEDGSCS